MGVRRAGDSRQSRSTNNNKLDRDACVAARRWRWLRRHCSPARPLAIQLTPPPPRRAAPRRSAPTTIAITAPRTQH